MEAALVAGGFFFVLLRAGWSPGEATGAGTPLHHADLMATTMSFFRTAGLGLPEIALLACLPPIVWGSDELRRAVLRQRRPATTPAPA